MIKKLFSSINVQLIGLGIMCTLLFMAIIYTAWTNIYDPELEKIDEERRERMKIRAEYYETLLEGENDEKYNLP